MNTECKFPVLAAGTAYCKGCRCIRCDEYQMSRIRHPASTKVLMRNAEILNNARQCCKDCGWNKEPTLLNFHHEVVESKRTKLGSVVNSSSAKRLLEELAKGCFLCPTCHALRHYNPITNKVEYRNSTLR